MLITAYKPLLNKYLNNTEKINSKLAVFRESLLRKVFFSTPHCASFHQERVIFEFLAILQDIVEK